MIKAIKEFNAERKQNQFYKSLFHRYKQFTMIPESIFYGNLRLINRFKNVQGHFAECGVWRGGMSAAAAELLGDGRKYYLFDSFEGLPEVKEIDGASASAWQSNKESEYYFDNCRAEIDFAQSAMKLTGMKNYELVKGWFADTLKNYSFDSQIAVLRLDGDWYESTMDCLKYLYAKVAPGGLIILDDYYTWDGCSRALHDFLSQGKLTERIQEFSPGICYLVKR